MEISKITKNFAVKRNLEVFLEENAEGQHILEIWEFEEDCEYLLTYFKNEDGSFTFRANNYLPEDIKEELPAHIVDEKTLRMVLAFIGSELKDRDI